MGSGMLRYWLKQIPLFWLLQAGGWGVYGVALLLATLPYLNLRELLIYRGVMTASCLIASFAIHAVCRSLWRRQARWLRALLTVLAWSYGLGFLCAAAALMAEDLYGFVPPHPFSWASNLNGTLNAGFVLLAWSVLYFGVKYYLALEAERQR